MENYIQAEDYELWMLIKNGPLIPTKVTENGIEVRKEHNEFDADDFKKMEKNAKAKKLWILLLHDVLRFPSGIG